MIYCIGDSHVSVFSGRGTKDNPYQQPLFPTITKGDLPAFTPIRLGAILAYNLVGKTSRIFEALEYYKVSRDDVVLLSFGEIDCRMHILRQAQIFNAPVKSLVEECVARYLIAAQIIANKEYRVGFWGPIASSIAPPLPEHLQKPEEFPVFGSCQERNHITQYFNEYLTQLGKAFGLETFSIFPELIHSDHLTRTEYYMDQIHLSQSAIPLIEKVLSPILLPKGL
ncbi:MAG: hypothetical protein AABZ13_00700 [Planctomycetota bacterium]